MGVTNWNGMTGGTGEPTYVGRTLRSGLSVQVMSDIWEPGALVLSEDETFKTVLGRGTVDATPEVVAKAIDLTTEANYRRLRDAEYRAYLDARSDLLAVEKGKDVKVVRGRKVPLDKVGTVIWVGETKFGWRVGLKDDEGEVWWTALGNVEVTNIDPDDIPLVGDFKAPEDEVRAKAREMAEYEWKALKAA